MLDIHYGDIEIYLPHFTTYYLLTLAVVALVVLAAYALGHNRRA